jgi:hypothetical protein
MALACRNCVFAAEVRMLGIPRRFSHFVFGVIQSGLTCAIAAAIASYPFRADGTFLKHWLQSGLVAWIMMLPVVVFAAPVIRNLTHIMTRED